MRASSYLLMLAALAFPVEAFAEDPPPGVRLGSEFSGFPALLTTFGGGMQSDQRIGVLGGDVLAGVGMLYGNDVHSLVLTPTLGWSGWRTFDEPSLRANTFTGRVDLGYMSFWTLQGITVFGAARVGSGRRVDPDSDRSSLWGAQVGVTYWPFVGWWPHAGVVGLECQWNHTNYLGEWHSDVRFVLNVNAGLLFIPLAAMWEAGIFGR
jgi:hypothetical protein